MRFVEPVICPKPVFDNLAGQSKTAN